MCLLDINNKLSVLSRVIAETFGFMVAIDDNIRKLHFEQDNVCFLHQ